MTNPVGDRAATFIATARDRTYSPDVIDMAKRCLVDWIGVATGAVDQPVSRTVRDTVMAWRAEGVSHILCGPKTAPALAALVNATMGHALDFDDTRGHAPSHLSSPTWSAVLALAEAHNATETEALNAFITGYEIAAVLGDGGIGNKMQAAGFHPTPVFGRLAAASASSVLLGLSQDQAANALGVAATTAGGLTASFGTMGKPFHSGNGAMEGVLAAELASRGFEAAPHLFDAEGAFAGTLVQDDDARLGAADFTAGNSLFDNSFKPYACGKLIHGHIDAARELRPKLEGKSVESIHCQVAAISSKLVGHPTPTEPLQGKFSIAFCVAITLLGYPAQLADFSAERLADPKVRDLMERVTLSVNPDIDRYGAIMDITLSDDSAVNTAVERSRGNPENPLSWDDLSEKFDGLVAPILGANTEPLYETLRRFEQPGSLARTLELTSA
ncbi:MAG: MmgE/PrpD family protein [Alphaproteobacteria bacterium]|nr:MmgE/PrpD family protein [Alphaproteobacteria bacterium]